VTPERRSLLERVGDAAVVQLYADGFDGLPLREKILLWHLAQAARAGRDIYYDQRYARNLELRSVLEEVLKQGDRVDPRVLVEIRRYTKLLWINTGPHNNLTARKFLLDLTAEQWRAAVCAAGLPEAAADSLAPILFDPAVDAVLTNKSPRPGEDILEASANNLYVNVRMADFETFTERNGLNSRLVKRADGTLVEEVYRLGGRYDREIRRIVGHLVDAIPYATPATADALRALIRFYETGDEADRMAYDIAWLRDRDSKVDTINGFVEVYMDPRGTKGAWEGIVYYVNEEKTEKIQTLAAHAQWFEDRMPWDPRFRKPQVTGVTAKAIEVVFEAGDSGPITPIGINLPNDQAIREQYGSKSVSLSNVAAAYELSMPDGLRTDFSWSEEEADRARQWGAVASELSTELHEVIGHGSGRMADTGAAPHLLLREQYSAVEESRADLVALYFLPDPKLAELGVVPAEQQEAIVRTEYEYFTRNALVQLRRVRDGSQIEEDHMRNRQMIVHWLRAHTAAVEVRRRDGKTYFVMADAAAFRDGVGRLLAEVQRIKGDGDYEAAKALFDTYGVHFDPALRDEVVARVDALQLPSYTAFVMPRLSAVRDPAGEIVDVQISYPCDLETQMLEYSAVSGQPD
jgi:dipeptidyl-peptidase-3